MARPLLTVRLPIELEQSLIFCAKELNKPKSELVNIALTAYLEDIQDFLSAKKALAETQKTYTIEEIKARHGLED
jgi:predicted DNA-binding protein